MPSWLARVAGPRRRTALRPPGLASGTKVPCTAPASLGQCVDSSTISGSPGWPGRSGPPEVVGGRHRRPAGGRAQVHSPARSGARPYRRIEDWFSPRSVRKPSTWYSVGRPSRSRVVTSPPRTQIAGGRRVGFAVAAEPHPARTRQVRFRHRVDGGDDGLRGDVPRDVPDRRLEAGERWTCSPRRARWCRRPRRRSRRRRCRGGSTGCRFPLGDEAETAMPSSVSPGTDVPGHVADALRDAGDFALEPDRPQAVQRGDAERVVPQQLPTISGSPATTDCICGVMSAVPESAGHHVLPVRRVDDN